MSRDARSGQRSPIAAKWGSFRASKVKSMSWSGGRTPCAWRRAEWSPPLWSPSPVPPSFRREATPSDGLSGGDVHRQRHLTGAAVLRSRLAWRRARAGENGGADLQADKKKQCPRRHTPRSPRPPPKAATAGAPCPTTPRSPIPSSSSASRLRSPSRPTDRRHAVHPLRTAARRRVNAVQVTVARATSRCPKRGGNRGRRVGCSRSAGGPPRPGTGGRASTCTACGG